MYLPFPKVDLRIESAFSTAVVMSDPSHRMSLQRALALVLIVGGGLVLAACDSSGANSDSGSIEGDWQTTIETDSITYDLAFELNIPEETFGSRIVGEGEFVAGEDEWAFEIPDGTYRRPSLDLTLRFDVQFDGRDLPITIQGTVGEDFQEISAQIFGGPPQFQGRDVTITRP
jgi:hypothetical protein